MNKPKSVFLDVNWKLLLLVLPVSSFPLLSKLFGGTMVAPLAMIPMAVLVLLFVLPEFFRTKTLPSHFQPLYVFFLIAAFSIPLAYMRELPTFRTIPIWKNALEGLATLAMGFGFYLVTICSVDSEERIRTALKWIHLGGAITILAACVQFAAYKLYDGFPASLERLQALISTAVRLYQDRATGLAFEPSWLAHQLNILYIPLWLGFTIKNETVYSKRLFGRIPYETLLLLSGLVSLFLSFSRVGWLSMIFVFIFLVFRLVNRAIDSVLIRLEKKTGKTRTRNQSLLSRVLLWAAVAVILLIIVFAAGVVMRLLDPRMEKLFDISVLREHGIMGWASRLSFAERITYWQTAFKVFLKHPFFGSGLGVAGYYYPETIPSFGYQLPETFAVMFYRSFIPNAKNLWVRLLAETGIVGFSVFVAWVVTHWRSAQKCERNKKSELLAAMGLTGQLLILAMIVEGFSLDTFGLPYYWIGFGLVAASWRLGATHLRLSKPHVSEQKPS